jgi:hypothetical protein
MLDMCIRELPQVVKGLFTEGGEGLGGHFGGGLKMFVAIGKLLSEAKWAGLSK